MIYLSREAVEKVFRMLIASLAEGGWLVTGPSDPISEERFQCESTVTPSGIAYRRILKAGSKIVFSPFESWKPSAPALNPASGIEAEVSLGKERPPGIPSKSPAGQAPAETVYSVIISKAETAFAQMDYGQVCRLTLPLIQETSACVLLLRALANLKDAVAAEQTAEKAIGLHPLSPELHFLRALLRMNGGKNHEAAADLRRTLYLDRSLAVAHFTLGLVLRRLGNGEGAYRAFDNALTLCRDLPPETILSLSDGESADHLMEACRLHLSGLPGRGSRHV
jgi:chemotaxis protein methyltransferase CheR